MGGQTDRTRHKLLIQLAFYKIYGGEAGIIETPKILVFIDIFINKFSADHTLDHT